MKTTHSMTLATVSLDFTYVYNLNMHMSDGIELGLLVWQDFMFGCGQVREVSL